MAAIDVEDIGEAIFEDPSDGVVIGQIVMLPKVSVFVEVYRCVVGGEDYTEPLESHVVVMDENDNRPICLPHGPSVSVPELSSPGVLWLLPGMTETCGLCEPFPLAPLRGWGSSFRPPY